MAVDIRIDMGLPEGASLDDAYTARGRLDADAEAVRFEGRKIFGARNVGGGVGGAFTGGAVKADAVYEAVNTRDALLAAALLASSLLSQGFTVRPHGEKLLVSEVGSFDGPAPGCALISVVARVGMS